MKPNESRINWGAVAVAAAFMLALYAYRAVRWVAE